MLASPQPLTMMLPVMLPKSFALLIQACAGVTVRVTVGALSQFGFLVRAHFAGKVGIYTG